VHDLNEADLARATAVVPLISRALLVCADCRPRVSTLRALVDRPPVYPIFVTASKIADADSYSFLSDYATLPTQRNSRDNPLAGREAPTVNLFLRDAA